MIDRNYRGKNIEIGGKPHTWFSICSRHRNSTTVCNLCMAGCYRDDAETKASQELYAKDPEAWSIWANSPEQYADFRERLEPYFPNLFK